MKLGSSHADRSLVVEVVLRTTSQYDNTAESLITELSGYVDLGMHRKALALVRRILQSSQLDADTFGKTVRLLLATCGGVKKLEPLVDAAYRRLPLSDRKLASSWMVGFYGSIPNEKIPAEFVRAKARNPMEAMFLMDVFIERSDLSLAKSLVRQCVKLLKSETDQMGKDILHHAIASYYAVTGKYALARNHWRLVSLLVVGQETMVGLVGLHTVEALREARAQLQRWEAQRKEQTDDLAISHPGLEDQITREFSVLLRRKIKNLERVLPPEKQKSFGL